MKPNETTAEPKLQPPGTGLPFSQHLFIKLWLAPVVSKRASPKHSRETYERLTTSLIEKVSSVSPKDRAIRILVDPILGLEDSSRFWSLNGVLEHLLIVSRAMESIILSLASGHPSDLVADVAKVKPTHFQDDALSEFRDYAPGLLKRIDEKLVQPGMSFESPLRHRHPWFGNITARQWYWILSSHQGIHCRQAKGILRSLGSSREGLF